MCKERFRGRSQYRFIHHLRCVMDHQPNLWSENHSIPLHCFYATLNMKFTPPLLFAATVRKCSHHLQANDTCPAHYCCSQQFPGSPWLLLITCRCIFPAPACWSQRGRRHFERTKSCCTDTFARLPEPAPRAGWRSGGRPGLRGGFAFAEPTAAVGRPRPAAGDARLAAAGSGGRSVPLRREKQRGARHRRRAAVLLLRQMLEWGSLVFSHAGTSPSQLASLCWLLFQVAGSVLLDALASSLASWYKCW